MAWSSTVIPIHAPREGCDPGGRACTGLLTDFNPRTPRGVRRPGAGRLHHQMPISIHAPREGCDGIGVQIDVHLLLISIHAPREGCDWVKARRAAYFTEFQSTHPARGATWPTDDIDEAARISIHAPREGCDMARSGLRRLTWISIHAPREGCDLFLLSVDIDSTNFNPRTPRGVRPHHIIDLYLCAFISIHAPREGCDRADGASQQDR